MNAFEKYHPFAVFIYFLVMIAITMLSTNPIVLGISLAGAAAYFIYTGGSFWGNIAFYIPFFLLIAVTNPLFSHNGETILFFLNDQRVTLEAVCYGLMMALMLVAVIFWFKCVNEVMTSDKIIYLFGKVLPKLSLILTMSLRFVPMLKRQAVRIHKTQKVLGLYCTDSITDRFLGGIRVFSALITWSLENAMETADSMKARGYGLTGRTSFSLYKWKARDTLLLLAVIILGVALLPSMAAGNFSFTFYPVMTEINYGIYPVISYILFGVMAFIPVAAEIKENIVWKLLISKI